MTIKVDYKGMKDLSGKEILEKSQEGKIDLPDLEGEDKEKFMKFVKMEPKSQERIDFINENIDPEETPIETPPVQKEPGDEPASIEEPQDKIDDSGDSVKPPVKEPGDEPVSEEEGLNAADLMTQLTKKDEELKKHRQSASEAGRRRKEAEDRALELEKLIKKQDAETKPVGKKPVRPRRPKVKDFGGDMFDDDYVKAIESYDEKFDNYELSLEEYQKSNEPEYVQKLRTELDEVKAKSETAYSYTQNDSTSKAEDVVTQAWDDVWSKTAKIQEKLGIKTSIDVKSIDHYNMKLVGKDNVDEKGNRLYSEVEIEEANGYITKLTPTDLENYQKTVNVVKNYFDFNADIPKVRYPELDENSVLTGIVKKNGIEVQNIKKVEFTEADRADALAKQQQRNDNHVSGMSGAQVGNSDGKLSDNIGKQEMENELREMAAIAKKNPGITSEKSSKYDKEFTQKYNKYRFDLFGHAVK